MLSKILKFIFAPNDRSRTYRNIVGILILAVFSVLFSYPKGPDWIRDEVKVHLGLDLAGGAHLEYQADVSDIPSRDRELAVAGTRDVIERRVNALGVSEPIVQTNVSNGDYRIIVELPGVTDVNAAIKRIGETPILEFKEPTEPPEPIPLSEEEIAERKALNEFALARAKEALSKAIELDEDGFSELANEITEDPGNISQDGTKTGGLLGFVRRQEIVPEFSDVLFDKMKDGEIYPELVETQFGYHIIYRVRTDELDIPAEPPPANIDIETETEGLTVEDITDESGADGKEIEKETTEEEIGGVTGDGELNGSNETSEPPAETEKEDSKKQTETVVEARHILIRTESLEPQVPPYDPWKNTLLSGKQLKRASVQFEQQAGTPQIGLEFNDEGADLFASITERNIGKPLAIFLDSALLSAPTVQQKITGGQAVITGTFTLEEAQDLARRLNAGALPIPLNLIIQQKIGASLGKASVEKSFLAGIIGLMLVALFMILYYRLQGFLSVLALGLYGLVMLSLFKLIPVVLTLSGMAGFILSLGFAVDANVLIFERIKEELRNGKPLGTAIDEGFSRAWNSIRDSNVSSLITAFVLIWFGTSMIKGFAITLSIGILVSMFSAIFVTKTLLKIFALFTKQSSWLWGHKISK